MSLLNQVLKDLDAQATVESSPDIQLAYSSETAALGVETVAPTDWIRLGVWSVVIGLLLIVLIAEYFYPAELTPVPKAIEADFSQIAVLPQEKLSQPEIIKAVDRVKPIMVSKQLEQQTKYLPLKVTKDPQIAKPKKVSKQITKSSAKPAHTGLKKIVKIHRQTPTERALSFIENGELSKAESLLISVLSRSPKNIIAQEMLIGLLVRGNRVDEALAQIKRSQVVIGKQEKLQLIQARLLVQQGDLSAAKNILEDILSAKQSSLDANRMIAAIYQQEGKFTLAINRYQQLISQPTANGSDWLGFAISLDSSNKGNASQVYEKALSFSDFPEAARSYVVQRLQALR